MREGDKVIERKILNITFSGEAAKGMREGVENEREMREGANGSLE